MPGAGRDGSGSSIEAAGALAACAVQRGWVVPVMSDDRQPAQQQDHEHDWQVVNHDENRGIYKCAACGELKRE